MKKIFISQPMRDLTEEEIKNAREVAKMDIENILNGEEYEILDTIFQENPDQGSYHHAPLYYLGKSIQVLGQADYAYFIEGWDKMRGCIVEHTVCKEYGVPIMRD